MEAAGKTVVFTNGCYDLLHPGHIRLLEQARSLGDVLILALNTDASVARSQGRQPSANSAAGPGGNDSCAGGCGCGDLFRRDTPRELIARLLPDVLIKGADWAHFIAGREEVEAAGGKVLAIALEPGYSTTNMVDEILRRRVTHPAVRSLFESLGRHPAFQEVVRFLERDVPQKLSLSGLTTTAKALYVVLLSQALKKPLLLFVDGNKQAEVLEALIQTFFDLLSSGRDSARPLAIPALDVLPSQNLSPHNEITEKRAMGLWQLATRSIPITIAPIASALLRTEPRDFYKHLALSLKVGEELAPDDLIGHIASIGYEKRDPVDMVGEYSLRGGILDIFPAEAEQPVRIEFYGDQIESMRRFDVESQRSILQSKKRRSCR
ncbi:MAG: adenylyltransferase/cytidyltransferase family protein [Bryobacteraceae bacterium]